MNTEEEIRKLLSLLGIDPDAWQNVRDTLNQNNIGVVQYCNTIGTIMTVRIDGLPDVSFLASGEFDKIETA